MTLKSAIVAAVLCLLAASEPVKASSQGLYDIGSPKQLKAAVASAVPAGVECVLLGEEVHASRGFYVLKAKILKELVSHHGFRRIAFEDNVLAVAAIDRYLQTGKGNLKAIMRAKLYRVWQAQSLLELFAWLRQWNQNAKRAEDKVRLYGFDIQGDDLLKGVSTGKSREIAAHRLGLVARQHFSNAKNQQSRRAARDKGMANVFLSLAKTNAYQGKTIIWTANGHGAKTSPGSGKNMGQYLYEVYRDKMRLYHVVADVVEVPTFWQQFNQKNPASLSHWLKTFKRQAFFMNFREVSRETFGLKPSNPAKPYDFIDGAFYMSRSASIKGLK